LDRFSATGAILDSDIYLNPNLPGTQTYGTRGTPGTYDLQVILTHEMGHAFGAGHSTLPTSTMFFSVVNLYQRTLSDDDRTFARAVYPVAELAAQVGNISGFVTLPTSTPARGALITAVDPFTGVTVGGVSSVRDGSFFLNAVPPGHYVVFAEPADGPVFPNQVGLLSSQVDTNFETSFHQSRSTVLNVTAGGAVNADIALLPRIGALSFDNGAALGRGSHGTPGDLIENQAAIELHPLETLDLLFGGPGADASITENDIEFLGPAIKIRAGSLIVDPFLRFPDGSRILRATVDVGSVPRRSVVSLLVRKGNSVVVRAGAFIVQPLEELSFSSNSVVNAASLRSGVLARNTWVSIFAEKLAPSFATGNGPLVSILNGTRVEVVDSRGFFTVAPLQFVSPTQLNFLMPPSVAPGPAQVQVYSLLGRKATSVNIAAVAPGIFAANSSGRGPAAAAFLSVAPDETRTTGFTFDAALAARPNLPISLGPEGTQVFLTIYGTGLRAHAEPVTATLGGLSVPVLAAVAQGQFAGLDQINVGPLPRELAGRGDVDLLFNVDGQIPNAVTVRIQ
jgi:uncharacterized protein (TIGR03437 family)